MKIHLLSLRDFIINMLSAVGYEDTEIAVVVNLNKSTVGRIIKKGRSKNYKLNKV